MAGFRLELHEANAWQRTALIATLIHNTNRGKGQTAARPDEFNPFAGWHKRRERAAMQGTTRGQTPCSIRVLKTAFIEQRPAE